MKLWSCVPKDVEKFEGLGQSYSFYWYREKYIFYSDGMAEVQRVSLTDGSYLSNVGGGKMSWEDALWYLFKLEDDSPIFELWESEDPRLEDLRHALHEYMMDKTG